MSIKDKLNINDKITLFLTSVISVFAIYPTIKDLMTNSSESLHAFIVSGIITYLIISFALFDFKLQYAEFRKLLKKK